MKKIEVLADAILACNGHSDPMSEFYRLRNPGALKGFIDRHKVDVRGYRVFDSYADGYRALIHDLEVKLSGKSTFGVGPKSPLIMVLPLFNVPLLATDDIVAFLSKALASEDITEITPLAFFQE